MTSVFGGRLVLLETGEGVGWSHMPSSAADEANLSLSQGNAIKWFRFQGPDVVSIGTHVPLEFVFMR